MFALIAAVLFGLALLFQLAGIDPGLIDATTLTTAGLLFLALNFAAGATGGGWSRRFRRR
ncbi:hypothetical protein R8Z50_09460 [Longispora sp. K20-0274]|uniref:hypothetical protein n=1 Tax=Longispora sp. K20-0274 TaxID=3088255 RepID=UPI00399B8E6E